MTPIVKSSGERAVRTYPFGAPDRLELHPLYLQLQEEEPLSRVRLPYGDESWLAVRYEDAKTVFADPRFSRAAALTRDEPRVSQAKPTLSLTTQDPPEHSRLRNLVAREFTTRRVQEMRPEIQRIAGDLLDQVVAAGPPAELVEDFALPLPVIVICELLGVPLRDRNAVRTWSEALMSTTLLDPEQRSERIGELRQYMAGLAALRRREPSDDLLSALVAARHEADKLTQDELVSLAISLLGAGHETTANQIINFAYVLLTHPDQLQLLCRSPELLPVAVEELLRYVPQAAAAAIPRYATQDVELSGGTVRAGEPVLVSRAAANRDPRAFDDPHRIDLTRSPNQHLGFGHGVHHCLGSSLARMELQVALSSLLTRLPGLRFAVDPERDLRWRTGMMARGLLALPAAWG